MGIVASNNSDLFIDLDRCISNDCVCCCETKVAQALSDGHKRIFLDFFNVNSFDNIFLDFIWQIKDKFESVVFYNIDIDLLPTFYIMNFDSIADVYTSKDDAIKQVKPLIKRRMQLV